MNLKSLSPTTTSQTGTPSWLNWFLEQIPVTTHPILNQQETIVLLDYLKSLPVDGHCAQTLFHAFMNHSFTLLDVSDSSDETSSFGSDAILSGSDESLASETEESHFTLVPFSGSGSNTGSDSQEQHTAIHALFQSLVMYLTQNCSSLIIQTTLEKILHSLESSLNYRAEAMRPISLTYQLQPEPKVPSCEIVPGIRIHEGEEVVSLDPPFRFSTSIPSSTALSKNMSLNKKQHKKKKKTKKKTPDRSGNNTLSCTRPPLAPPLNRGKERGFKRKVHVATTRTSDTHSVPPHPVASVISAAEGQVPKCPYSYDVLAHAPSPGPLLDATWRCRTCQALPIDHVLTDLDRPQHVVSLGTKETCGQVAANALLGAVDAEPDPEPDPDLPSSTTPPPLARQDTLKDAHTGLPLWLQVHSDPNRI